MVEFGFVCDGYSYTKEELDELYGESDEDW